MSGDLNTVNDGADRHSWETERCDVTHEGGDINMRYQSTADADKVVGERRERRDTRGAMST